MTDVASDLTDRLLEHCGFMCETGAEGPIADHVEQRYRDRGADVARIGNSVVASTPGSSSGDGQRPTIALVGHLDVVAPTPDDMQPRVEERDGTTVVVGRGTSDMKSGNVVAMRLFEEVLAGQLATPYRLALVMYAQEEGAAERNELALVLDEVDWLSDVALAIIMEPTDGDVQLGCLGGLHATITVRGRQAHSARPWQGHNALTVAAPLIAAFGALDPRPVEIDGVTFHDVWTLTQASTDNGRNLVPGEVTLNLNYRFAPSRSLHDAEADLYTTVTTLATTAGIDLDESPVGIEIVDRAPPAPPRATDPIVGQFIEAAGAALSAKQAWTDVARFAAVGVPALNYGPGRTDQAHQRGEYAEVPAMVAAYSRLRQFLGGGR